MATVKKPVKKTTGKPSGKKPSGKGGKKRPVQNSSNTFMVDFKEKHAEAYAILVWLAPIFGGILLGIIFSKFSGLVTGESTRRILEQTSAHIEYQNEIESLTNQYNELQQDVNKYSKEKYYSGDSELDVASIADRSFFDKYLTWSSNDEYLQNKLSLEGFGYREGSSFHDVVYSAESVNYACESLGGTYYKLSVDGMNIYYAGEICVKVTPEDGSAPVWRYLYVTFTINGQNVTNVQAAALDKEKTGSTSDNT